VIAAVAVYGILPFLALILSPCFLSADAVVGTQGKVRDKNQGQLVED
jgi:hypothetical protein